MRTLGILLVLCLTFFLERETRAFNLYLGPGFSFYNQNSSDELENIKQYNIEFNFYLKKNFIDNFRILLGGHLNFSLKNNYNNYPSSIHIERNDFRNFYSLGLSYKYYIEPLVSYAVGFDFKTLSLKTNSVIIEKNSPYPIKKFLLYQHIQVGISFPIFNDMINLTPFYRFLFIRDDSTYIHGYGLELIYKVY